jgi:hypothetical protein
MNPENRSRMTTLAAMVSFDHLQVVETLSRNEILGSWVNS